MEVVAHINLSLTLSLMAFSNFLKGEKLTDDGRQVMAKAHISIGKVS
jgi:hypothetical protein